MLRSMALKDLNPHIICVLCGGYLVDATTIIECLHCFCRSCIIRWLEASYHCPVCDAEVHKTRPLLNIRPDRVLQDIVYKLVPGLYHRELQCRKDFEAKVKEAEQECREEKEQRNDKENKNSDEKTEEMLEDPVCITLEYYGSKRNWREKPVFPTRYLRCSSKMTVNVLKKFVIMKFSIPRTHAAEIVRSDEILSDHLSMKEVSGIYGLHSKSFLDLQYVFIEASQENDTEEVKQEERQKNYKKFKLTTEKKPEYPTQISVTTKIELSQSFPQDQINNGLTEPLASRKTTIVGTSLRETTILGTSLRDTTILGTSLRDTLPTEMETRECPETPESDKLDSGFPAPFGGSVQVELPAI